jgi:hypothetical protein
MKSLLNHTDYRDKKYEPESIDESTLEMGKKVLGLYSRINSTEIWNEETVNSLLRQLEYYTSSGIIMHKEIALALCDDTDALIDHIGRQAEEGAKFSPGTEPLIPGNFKLYHNEVILGDNTVHITSEQLKMTFITMNVLNLMVTTEENFCNKVGDYLTTMMKKSSLISKDSEKERTRFVNLMHQKVVVAKERIKHL